MAATKEITLLPTSTTPPQNAVVSLTQPHQLLFQNAAVSLHTFPPFNRSDSGDPGLKTTRELTSGFVDNSHRFYQPPVEFGRPVYATPVHAWNVNHGNGSDGDDDDDDDDNDDEDDDVEDDDEVKLNESGDINSTPKNGKSIHLSSSFGSNRGLLVKERNVLATGNDSNDNDMGNCNNVGGSLLGNRGDQSVTIAGTNEDLYYSQRYMQVQEGSTSMGQKDVSLGEIGGGLSSRKDVYTRLTPGSL